VRHRLETVLRRLPITASAAILALAGSLPLLAMSGCADQGEGERCTRFPAGDAGTNGSSECASGLICTAPNANVVTLTTPGVGNVGVCCPPSGTPSSAAACTQTTSGSTTGGPPAGDGGFDGATTDAAADGRSTDAGATGDAATAPDASKDGGKDAAPDATTDATTGATTDAATDAPRDSAKSG